MKKAIWLVIFCLFIMSVLYPPWRCCLNHYGEPYVRGIKFAPCTSPPEFYSSRTSFSVGGNLYYTSYPGEIYWKVVYIEWVILTILFIVAGAIFGKRGRGFRLKVKSDLELMKGD